MSIPQATAYRWRASHLRTLAHHMTSASAMSLQRHADVSTWFGPRADFCRHALASAQRGVHLAADDLRDRAWRFDRIADDLEAAGPHAALELAD